MSYDGMAMVLHGLGALPDPTPAALVAYFHRTSYQGTWKALGPLRVR